MTFQKDNLGNYDLLSEDGKRVLSTFRKRPGVKAECLAFARRAGKRAVFTDLTNTKAG